LWFRVFYFKRVGFQNAEIFGHTLSPWEKVSKIVGIPRKKFPRDYGVPNGIRNQQSTH